MYSKHLHIAKTAAQKAGAFLLEQQNKVRVKEASVKDFVTEQDLESENMIMDVIRKEFPDAEFLAEEASKSGSLEELPKKVWIIDPIDGTSNFANGSPFFSVSIAYCENKETKIGVVYAPKLGEMFTAEIGKGAQLNNAPFQMNFREQPFVQALVAAGVYPYKLRPLPAQQIDKMLKSFGDLRRYGSAAIEICYVAAGRCGAFFEEGIKPWDVAAAVLILKEQKGLMANFDGTSLDMFRVEDGKYRLKAVFSKNTEIHNKIVEILKTI